MLALDPTAGEVGGWLVAAVFLMGGLWVAMQIYDRIIPRKPEPTYLTRLEFDSFKEVLTNKLSEVTVAIQGCTAGYVNRREYDGHRELVGTRMQQMDEHILALDHYTHERNLILADKVSQLAIEMAVLGKTVQPALERLAGSVDKMELRLNRMAETLKCPAAHAELQDH